ncbi:MAG: TIGR04282 family arsenosugar biosynthesis glycosyltransferase [Gemmatimonadetes bacterium]|nr:TIGR04282 family arsenosugar biosynthesis glycosyltransferase [Gemmatimonadota bacterium]
MPNALVLFMKAPRPGTVKTRLTPRVSMGEAAELYSAFILDTLHLAQRVTGTSLFVAWTPDDGLAELQSALRRPGGPGGPGGPDVNWFGQQGGHLGERLSNAFAVFLKKGWDKTVVLGGDSPLLPHAFVEEAFDSLDRHDVVLGPAADGGYYLIGLRGLRRPGGPGGPGRSGHGGRAAGRYASLFESIHWGTDRVLRQTRAAIRACGLSCHELPTWHDVDRPGDLDRIARDIRSLRASGDHVTGRHTESALEAVTRGRNPA